jgi:hypothetical protein
LGGPGRFGDALRPPLSQPSHASGDIRNGCDCRDRIADH